MATSIMTVSNDPMAVFMTVLAVLMAMSLVAQDWGPTKAETEYEAQWE